MKVLIKEPKQEPKVVDMHISLMSLQNVVGGFIESICIEGLRERKIICYCNEGGKILELEPNFRLVMGGEVCDIVCGTVIFLGDDEDGGEKSLNRYNIEVIKNYLERWGLE